MSDDERYLVCGCTPWAREIYERRLRHLPGEWVYVDDPGSLFLYPHALSGRRYAFFLHWRWKVTAEVLAATECVGFHLGRLPQERGGSPLQHRILAGQSLGVLTSFRMTEAVDAGPVYVEQYVPLHGPAEAIYRRAMRAAAAQIGGMVEGRVDPPAPQEGFPRSYSRLQPKDSELPDAPGMLELEDVYDRVRMVDAEGYPPAYLDYGGFRFSFRRAVHYGDRVEVDCVIRVRPDRQGEAG